MVDYDVPPPPPDEIIYVERPVLVFRVRVAVAAFALSFFRRPFRRDLAWLSATLPLGVVAQAVLGGFTVRAKLPAFPSPHRGEG